MAIGVGRSGLIAIIAVAIAAAAIAYRIKSDGGNQTPSALSEPPGSIGDLARRAEEAPGDAGAWQKLGFAQFDQGNFEEAVKSYTRATEISPRSAVLWSSLGEARVMASQTDPMPPAALDAFRKAIAIDPKEPRARYFMAVQKDLQGNHEAAIAEWLSLLKDTPAGAPWDSDLQRTIEQVGKINKIDVASRLAAATADRGAVRAPADMAIPGPTQQQLAAASSLPPGAQQAMAESMVARLAQKLKDDPTNTDGWIMLMRSYKTLGRDAEARTALASAVAANPARAGELRSAAASLGIGL